VIRPIRRVWLVALSGACAVGVSAAFVACSSSESPSPVDKPSPTQNQPSQGVAGRIGTIGLQLSIGGGETVNTVNYTLTGPNAFSQAGTINVANSATISAIIAGIPAGSGYSISLSAVSTDGTVTCSGSSMPFTVASGTQTAVSVTLTCSTPAPDAGTIAVTVTTVNCASISGITVTPSNAYVGGSMSLAAAAQGVNPAALTYSWTATTGTLANASTSTPTFTCTSPGSPIIALTVTDGSNAVGCQATQNVTVTCDGLNPNSLVISSSTYSNTQGAVASLMVGTTLPGSNGTFNTNGTVKKQATTVTAVAGNDYVNVWNNAPVDGSFGVTSAIQLSVLNASNNQVLNTVSVPASQVVTSFSSKSELGLHYGTDSSGNPHIVFVAYAGAGVGALDVSNSDAVPGQDPTNPVTFVFGSSYAFARTVVSMDMMGNFAYTPTIDYGGNNGRNALLGPNGLYYAVGNANNGGASTFGPNGTSPDVTETTGVEVVTPINGSTSSVTIPPNNSAEVDPSIQLEFFDGGLITGPLPDGGTLDKAGKDDNYRGLTQYGGALYFTKGSGSNGIDTVYTVPLPTVANAASQTVSVVPGFPTDQARLTNGDFTPFAVFFANPTTMYVTDEGTGSGTTDGPDSGPAGNGIGGNAGLEKWSLVNGTWQLDYVLQSGLIGVVDSNVTGSDGPWPNIKTIGLRNMDGVVNQAAGTVTLWAVTSTLSTSGDNGADPNKVVTITDQISATTLPANESFSVVVGPTYGTVYRGAAYVP
jgi:hypothetical protein